MAQNAVNSSNFNKEIVRPVANFSPSLWGDLFLNYVPDAQAMQEYSKEVEVLKEEVRSMLTAPASCNMLETMDLIDTLERLCLSYHFEDEIEEKLEYFFKLNKDYKNEVYDLYTVALHFRLIRARGHRMSSDVFSKFKDDDGNFREALKSDARGLLSLYEAVHLRIHGEDILDEALVFAIVNLKAIAQNLCSPLKEEVLHALHQPLHLGSPRIEARVFISAYEKREQKNEPLLRFAKLDYNLLQMLHKEELCEISRWWKELDLPSKLPYFRDRVVECYFFALGVYYEPQYSRSRIFITKAISMTTIIDDTYDSYGTIEELDAITAAIGRWDVSQIDQVPDYFKPFYKVLLELFEQFEEELSHDGKSYGVYYGKETLKELVRSYHVEAKWFLEGYLPPFNQYLSNALITGTNYYHTIVSLFGTNFATKEQYEWLMKKPKVLVAVVLICRVIDDVATYEVEKERGQTTTGIECYMRENGVTIKEAMDKFLEIANTAWKDVNAELLKPTTYSRDVLMRILNFTRVVVVTYKDNQDGYTKPEKVLKPHIIALVVDPIKI